MSEAAAAADGVTAGMLLRHAREQAGLHVDTLAANLKVPVRKLEALEDDQYDELGDVVFVRALASSICRTLKLDPQPVLQRLPQTASPRLAAQVEGINAPFRTPNDAPAPGLLDQLSRPVVLIVIVLLLGALVIIFLPLAQHGYDVARQAMRPAPATTPAAETPVAEAPLPAEPASTPEAAQLSAAAPAQVAPAGASDATAAPTAASADSGAVAAARPASGPAVAAPQVAASGPIAASGTVTFRTSGPSWIQVTDATGATVLRKLMQAGESAGASGTPPLSVTVGSVAATEVQVRGQPYNLAPVARDNVARFSVK